MYMGIWIAMVLKGATMTYVLISLLLSILVGLFVGYLFERGVKKSGRYDELFPPK